MLLPSLPPHPLLPGPIGSRLCPAAPSLESVPAPTLVHQGAECTALARPELVRWLKIPGEKVPVEREEEEGRREGRVPGLSECGGGGGSGEGGGVAGETADPLLPQHCSDSMKPSFSWPTGSTSA